MISACAMARKALKTLTKLRCVSLFSIMFYLGREPLGLWFYGATMGPFHGIEQDKMQAYQLHEENRILQSPNTRGATALARVRI